MKDAISIISINSEENYKSKVPQSVPDFQKDGCKCQPLTAGSSPEVNLAWKRPDENFRACPIYLMCILIQKSLIATLT